MLRGNASRPPGATRFAAIASRPFLHSFSIAWQSNRLNVRMCRRRLTDGARSPYPVSASGRAAGSD
ncbi:hypothetical protein GPU89_13900 [Burkholderia cepacia]|nr:hypothetical protein [Burkholderia cepacia]